MWCLIIEGHRMPELFLTFSDAIKAADEFEKKNTCGIIELKYLG